MELKHCVMDLEDIVREMRERLKKNVEYVKERGFKLTKVEENRFEVGHLQLMNVVDDLERVIAAWKDGAPARRVTEEAITKGV